VKALSDFVVFKDSSLRQRWAGQKPAMSSLCEAYLDEALDIVDLDGFFEARAELVAYSLTLEHVKQFVTRMVPEWTLHSLAQDRRLVREHYDRGDDFFAAFLGERMVYTSGIFHDESQSLEQGQDNKLDLVCQKIGLQRDAELLDIGCGWGTLALHAAKQYGARTTGVTLSQNQTAFGNARIERAGLAKRARIECCDYREIPAKTYDRIVSLEMVEHVGLKHLDNFFQLISERLKDDGLFFLQFAGLRRGGGLGVPPVGMRPEDMIWGLFMNKYIFPGADASLCPSAMLASMEKAGWEMHSVENVSHHYGWTIKRWHDNWLSNRAAVVAAYGERWFRIWHLFLAWSAIIGEQGNAACFQVVLNKNVDAYDRFRWIRRKAVILGDRTAMAEVPAVAAAGG